MILIDLYFRLIKIYSVYIPKQSPNRTKQYLSYEYSSTELFEAGNYLESEWPSPILGSRRNCSSSQAFWQLRCQPRQPKSCSLRIQFSFLRCQWKYLSNCLCTRSLVSNLSLPSTRIPLLILPLLFFTSFLTKLLKGSPRSNELSFFFGFFF